MTDFHEEALSTSSRCLLIDITDRVQEALSRSGLRNGICLVSVSHTTAGVLVNENADPDVCRDVLAHLERMVPARADFRHAEGNSDAHIKAILTGSSLSLPVREGRLVLGTWQGIYFAEFDGPRRRSWRVDFLGNGETE